MLAATALAQTNLPPIVVQGATLERSRATQQGSETPATTGTAPATTGEGASAGTGTGDGTAGSDRVEGVPIDSIGTAVTVVTREDLERQQTRNAADALRSLPGVAVSRQGSVGSMTQVRIRGAEGNHTLVLIDGVVANNTADGEFDFASLSAEDIERIEVIRGPMSGIFGTNAVGGVVNIITRAERGPLAFTTRLEGGSFGTKDLAMRLGGGNDQGYLTASYQVRDIRGFNIAPQGNENDGTRLSTFAFKGGGKITPDATLDINLRHIERRAMRDGFGDFTAPDGTLAATYDDASIITSSMWLGGARLKWDTFGDRLTHEVRFNHNSTRTADFDDSFKSRVDNFSQTNTFGYVATYRLGLPLIWGQHAVTGLAEKVLENFTPTGDFADGIERDRSRIAVAGEWRSTFAERLSLSAGVRHDDNDNFPDFTTWRSSASLKLVDPKQASIGVRPHASVGTAVKLPTMFEQFGSESSQFKPNPNLRPETSFGWDAGIELSTLAGRATLDVTYFRADLEDKIKTVGFPFTPINAEGRSTREGVEVAVRYQVLANLSLGAAYTFTDARDPDGQREPRRPPHAAKADVAYTFHGGRGTATLAAIYNGSMDDIAFRLPNFDQVRVILGEYWLLTAGLSYKIQPNVEVYGRVENLLDAKYQEVYGFSAAGVAAYAGVKIKFDDIGAGAR